MHWTLNKSTTPHQAQQLTTNLFLHASSFNFSLLIQTQALQNDVPPHPTDPLAASLLKAVAKANAAIGGHAEASLFLSSTGGGGGVGSEGAGGRRGGAGGGGDGDSEVRCCFSYLCRKTWG